MGVENEPEEVFGDPKKHMKERVLASAVPTMRRADPIGRMQDGAMKISRYRW